MLNVPRLLVVAQILVELLIRQMPPKPGAPPEKKRHQDDEPSGGKKENLVRARHAALGLGFEHGVGFGMLGSRELEFSRHRIQARTIAEQRARRGCGRLSPAAGHTMS